MFKQNKNNILNSYLNSYGYDNEGRYIDKPQTSQSIYKISQEQYDIIKKLSIYNVDVAKCEELLNEMKIATEERQKSYDDLQNYENSYTITKYTRSLFFDKQGTEKKIVSLENQIIELSNELKKYGIEYKSFKEATYKIKDAKIQRKNNKNDLKSLVEENIEFLHIVQDSKKNITFEFGDNEISINRDRFLKNLESDGIYSNKDLTFETRENEISNIQNDLWSDLANQVNPINVTMKDTICTNKFKLNDRNGSQSSRDSSGYGSGNESDGNNRGGYYK